MDCNGDGDPVARFIEGFGIVVSTMIAPNRFDPRPFDRIYKRLETRRELLRDRLVPLERHERTRQACGQIFSRHESYAVPLERSGDRSCESFAGGTEDVDANTIVRIHELQEQLSGCSTRMHVDAQKRLAERDGQLCE